MIEAVYPGQKLMVKNQGSTITPQSTEVEVVWVTETDVHYRRGWYPRIYQTPIARFLEVINQ